MTMPRKKSRPAEVDGRQYRFIVKDAEDGNVWITVEDSTYRSRPLEAEVYSHGVYGGIGKPQIVALVRAGRLAGWSPETTTRPFRLDMLQANLALEGSWARHRSGV